MLSQISINDQVLLVKIENWFLIVFVEDHNIYMGYTKEELEQVYRNQDDLINRIKEVSNHTFKEFDVNNRLQNKNNKGRLGQIIEEGVFGYDINSNEEADFDYLDLELKTTGVLRNKDKTIKAKERLPLETLNYNKIVNQTFVESDLIKKNKGLFIVLYEFIKGIDYGDMHILKGFVHRFSDRELAILENDFNEIKDKVERGEAHLISEGDTMLLGACTAGTGKLITQPYSSEGAKQRKYCLKQTYMTQIIKDNLGYKELESILDKNVLVNNSFEMTVTSILSKYQDMSVTQLCKLLKVNTEAKSKLAILMSRMLGLRGDINKAREFVEANIKCKTIRVEENGQIIQSMSFPAFEFLDIVNEQWEESDFRTLLDSQKFMFSVFKRINGEYYFKGVRFWHAPVELVDTKGRDVFEALKKTLLAGKIVKGYKKTKSKTIRITYFPGMKFNGFIHIRPHGLDTNNTAALPVKDVLTGADVFTKQCFWFNNSYVKSVIIQLFGDLLK